MLEGRAARSAVAAAPAGVMVGVMAAALLGAAAAGCGDPDGPPAGRRPAPAAAADVAPLATQTPTIPPAVAEGDDLERARDERLVIALRADPSSDVRRRAIDVYLRRVGQGASPEPLLEACACDRDPLVRRWAALALAASPDPALAARLGALAVSEPDPAVRAILERGARVAAQGQGHQGVSRIGGHP
ncbi:MAG: HEAT repeat domain-containing protein [Planctomycetes bacterium]|nr:HEAT repeat domain-containing protein [Planctomycetota bacterium]